MNYFECRWVSYGNPDQITKHTSIDDTMMYIDIITDNFDSLICNKIVEYHDGKLVRILTQDSSEWV